MIVNPELYDRLDLATNATPGDIRAAYRSKAKRLHPDMAGGDAVAFEQLKQAHDILTDEIARERYDSTGEIVPRNPDQGNTPVWSLISQALDQVLGEAQEKLKDPTTFFLSEAVRAALETYRQQAEKMLSEYIERRSLYERVAGRFIVPDPADENVLRAVALARIGSLDQEIAANTETRKNIAAAQELIRHAGFLWTPAVAVHALYVNQPDWRRTGLGS